MRVIGLEVISLLIKICIGGLPDTLYCKNVVIFDPSLVRGIFNIVTSMSGCPAVRLFFIF